MQFHLPLFHYRYFSVFCARVNDGDKIYWHESQSTYKTINRQFETWSMICSTMALIRIEGSVLTIAGRKKAAEKLINKKKMYFNVCLWQLSARAKDWNFFLPPINFKLPFLNLYAVLYLASQFINVIQRLEICECSSKWGGGRGCNKKISFIHENKTKKKKPQRLLSWTYGLDAECIMSGKNGRRRFSCERAA